MKITGCDKVLDGFGWYEDGSNDYYKLNCKHVSKCKYCFIFFQFSCHTSPTLYDTIKKLFELEFV